MLRAWRIFAVSVALLGFWLGAGIYYGGHEWEIYQEKKQAIEKAAGRIAALNELQQEHPNLEGYQMEIAKQRQKAERLLPANMQMAELLAYVQQSARSSGMELQEVVPVSARPQGKLTVQPVKVRLQGDYFAMLDFLCHLDRGTPLVKIGTMELRQEQEGLDSRLVLNFYAG